MTESVKNLVLYLGSGFVSLLILLTPFALFDKWRSSLYDPILLLGAVLIGLILNLIALATRQKPMVIGLFASVVLFVGLGFLLAAMSSPNDLPDALYMLALFCSFPILNACLFKLGKQMLSATT